MAEAQIRYLKHDQIDLQRWDHCMENAFNSYACAESWYLDIVSPRWCALVQGDYERIMPLPEKKRLGLHYLMQPLFIQQLGIFSTRQLDNLVVQQFIKAIPKRYLYININFNTHNHLVIPGKLNLNHELDLIDEISDLRERYSTNLKRNLKKGVKNNLQVVKHISPEEVIRLFRHDRGATLRQWDDEHYRLLQRLIYSGIHKHRMDLYGVTSANNTILAGAVFLKSRGSVVFLFSGNSAEGKEKGAMPLLIDKYLEDHAEMQLTFDFEGSNDTNGFIVLLVPHLSTTQPIPAQCFLLFWNAFSANRQPDNR